MIVLENPKFARNVAEVVRLAAGYGMKKVYYSGTRVNLDDPSLNLDPKVNMGGRKGLNKPRLPRELRLQSYKGVEVIRVDRPFDLIDNKLPIVGVELKDGAMPLQYFEHPTDAVYVFGPEDGNIEHFSKYCHMFLVIPTCNCLNLATSVATVLWDKVRDTPSHSR